MFELRHKFVIEVCKRHSSVPLGRVKVPVDFVPIEEALALDLLCAGGENPTGSAKTTVRIDPEWSVSGQPQIKGLRATLLREGVPVAEVAPRRFPLTYFSNAAQLAADHYVEAGALSAGEFFDNCILAFPLAPPPLAPPPALPPPPHPPLISAAAPRRPFTVENSVIPVTLQPANFTTLMDAALMLGTGEAEDLPVFVHWNVLQQISALTRRAGGLETGGVLTGHLCRDGTRVFLEITAQIPSPAPGELTRLAFTPAVWRAMQAAAGAQAAWVGWWHCHSWSRASAAHQASIDDATRTAQQSSRPFFSDDDCLVHRTVFARAFNVALLVTDSAYHGMTWTAFGWRAGQIVSRAFHVLDAPLSDTFLLPTGGANHAPNGSPALAH